MGVFRLQRVIVFDEVHLRLLYLSLSVHGGLTNREFRRGLPYVGTYTLRHRLRELVHEGYLRRVVIDQGNLVKYFFVEDRADELLRRCSCGSVFKSVGDEELFGAFVGLLRDPRARHVHLSLGVDKAPPLRLTPAVLAEVDIGFTDTDKLVDEVLSRGSS